MLNDMWPYERSLNVESIIDVAEAIIIDGISLSISLTESSLH